MKKFIFTLLVILLFSVSGWAEDQQTTDTTLATGITPQETIESTPETSEIASEPHFD
jgi:hypothetical protein